MFSAGIADKLGNRYEAKWLVRLLLEVLQGKADWLCYEGIAADFQAFECVLRRNGVSEWHQSKINNTRDNWTIGRLKTEGVLASFRRRLAASSGDRCLFVSQDPAKGLARLIESVKRAKNLKELLDHLSTTKDDRTDWELLKTAWDTDDATLWDWMHRCEARTVPEFELESLIESHGSLLFHSPSAPIFPVLRDYLDQHFNHTLTAETVREHFRSLPGLRLKDWSLDPTLRQRLLAETDAYLESYSPFGAAGSIIPRRQATEAADRLLDPEGPLLVLVHGVAGSGKSAVVRQVVERLRDAGVPHLALRIDQHLSFGHPRDFGERLTGRPESPTTTLKGLEPEAVSVLILDQVDAVSELSGRDGAVREAVLRMVDESRWHETVKIVLVCRTFDLEGDRRLKTLDSQKRVCRIAVPLLDWGTEAAPLLCSNGRDPASLTERQRELLRLPLHLALYLEVAGDAPGFQSRNDLLAALLERQEREIRQRPSPPHWSVVQVLTELAQWMSEGQRLDSPVSVIQSHPGAADLLTSAGLIVRSRTRIGFFHESLFDYLYARAFAAGTQRLLELLTSTEQHLFRRTQIRQILETLRQEDLSRYLTELRSVLTSEHVVRYHVRLAVAQWLGALPDPSERERELVLSLDSGGPGFDPIFRAAVLGTAGWFRTLHALGWIDATLTSVNASRREDCLWWLSTRVKDSPAEVSGILDRWWRRDPRKGQRLLAWLPHARHLTSDPSVTDLCDRVIRSNPPGLFAREGADHEILLASNGAGNAGESARILSALFEVWFASFPGEHPFLPLGAREDRGGFPGTIIHDLSGIAEAAPQPFLDATIPVLIRSLAIAGQRRSAEFGDWSFSCRIEEDPLAEDNVFLSLIASALKTTAISAPDRALEYLTQIDPSEHECLLYLHLETVAANGAALAHCLLTLIGRNGLFNAGSSGVEWQSFAKAARAALPYLSADERDIVEGAIFRYNPNLCRAQRRAGEILVERTVPSQDNRRWVLRALARSGYEQWCVLGFVGPELLTAVGRGKLAELNRKFSPDKRARPLDIKMREVISPIAPERAQHMTDRHWLGAIEKYADDSWRNPDGDFIRGGAEDLAQTLESQAALQPARFAAFVEKIPDHANPCYISSILQGLADSKVAESTAVGQAIRVAHGRQPGQLGTEIARIVRKHPDSAVSDEVFETLLWYVKHGDGQNQPGRDLAKTERELARIEDLLNDGGMIRIRGINGARGHAIEALAAVCWTLPNRAEAIWKIIERRIDIEPLISVRCSITYALRALFNHDKERCAAAMERLIAPPTGTTAADPPGDSTLWLAPAATYEALALFRYLRYWTPGAADRLADALVASTDSRMSLLGAWHRFLWSFYDPSEWGEADRLLGLGAGHRRVAASIAAQATVTQEYRSRAEDHLRTFFGDEDELVRQQAATVFRFAKPVDFVRALPLAESFVETSAFDHNADYFLRALQAATCNVSSLVIRAAERIIDQHSQEHPAARRRHRDIHHLADLLKREYASSESDPPLRARLLDLLDRMLALDIGGAHEIIQVHERD